MKRTKAEYNNLLKLAKETALEAGSLLIKYQKQLGKLQVESKKALGVVSEADVNSEKLIIKKFKNFDSSFNFLGEEGHYQNHGESKIYNESEDNLWIIDPLDGTSNYLSGLDLYCICLALVDKGSVVLSVVYAPALEEMYYAVKGEGSFYQKSNSKPKKLKCSKIPKLKDSLLVTGFVSEKGSVFEHEFSLFREIMTKCRGVRRLGSAALDICFVAKGVLDGFWERGLSPWDTAAPSLIATEAGYKISDYCGKKYSPFDETVLCCNKSIAPSLKKILNK